MNPNIFFIFFVGRSNFLLFKKKSYLCRVIIFFVMATMTATISIPQEVALDSPLGALIAHFNSSSQSVKKAFAKFFAEYSAREAELKLKAKIERGEQAIRNGQGISQKEGESNEEFLERLCTM
ncbi:MAG: hypothetical protein MJZ66_11525 [Bacteroidales bacterium]|nr:hypothetical protein [Bacteroidales bacterium]